MANSVFRQPDEQYFNLTGTYILPRLIVRNNIQLSAQLNGQPNFIRSIVRLENDPRPLQYRLIFKTNIAANHLVVNSLINRRLNMSHLLHDAVYSHLPQHITGEKIFQAPIKIVGNVFMNHPNPIIGRYPQLNISGSINQVNIRQLFAETVRSDRPQVISGHKHFTGKIRFLGDLYLRGGLNGAQLPDGYYLRQSNETITGQVLFTKKTYVKQNLNTRLINHFNLTHFLQGLIYLDNRPSSGLPPSFIHFSKSVPITTSMTFMDGVNIRNLTVTHKINDIHVGDLLHTNSHKV